MQACGEGEIMKITLYNDFHGTAVNLFPKNDRLSPGQIKRAKQALCGMSWCSCSDSAGCRGYQDFVLDFEHDGGASVWEVDRMDNYR
jgi:hypothetical protein